MEYVALGWIGWNPTGHDSVKHRQKVNKLRLLPLILILPCNLIYLCFDAECEGHTTDTQDGKWTRPNIICVCMTTHRKISERCYETACGCDSSACIQKTNRGPMIGHAIMSLLYKNSQFLMLSVMQ